VLFGVGLVLFDVDKTNPRFSIRVRAQRFSPDMFYVNEFAERLKLHEWSSLRAIVPVTRSPRLKTAHIPTPPL
jgi:hypothetical protein